VDIDEDEDDGDDDEQNADAEEERRVGPTGVEIEYIALFRENIRIIKILMVLLKRWHGCPPNRR